MYRFVYFVNGDRVVVRERRGGGSYRGKYAGCKGTVRSCNSFGCGSIGVELDGEYNPASGKGIFWFKGPELALFEDLDHPDPLALRDEAEEETRGIKIEHVVEEEIPMLKGYIAAGVSFPKGSNRDTVYPYALYPDLPCQVGDQVVVMTGHHGMALAEVKSIGELPVDSVDCGREIICKVDMAAYVERKARAEKLASLKKEMDAKVRELQSVALYEALAEKDPTLKAMLDEFKSLL